MSTVKEWMGATRELEEDALRHIGSAVEDLRAWPIFNKNYPEMKSILIIVDGELARREYMGASDAVDEIEDLPQETELEKFVKE